MRWQRVLLFVSAWLLLAAGAATLAHNAVRDWASAVDAEQAGTRLARVGASLHSELARFDAWPHVLAMDGRLVAALTQPDDAPRRQAATHHLQEVMARTGVQALVLVDRQGVVVAASHAEAAHSVAAGYHDLQRLAAEAVDQRSGRLDVTRGVDGGAVYLHAAPVHAAGRPAGAVAIQVPLDALEALLADAGMPALVADATGRVLLASEKAWRQHRLHRVGIPRRPPPRVDGTGERPRLAPAAGASAEWRDPAIDTARMQIVRPVPGRDWRMVAYTELPLARLLAGLAAAFAACAVVATGVAAHAVALRHQRLREQTAELARTEALLRETTDAALQAGRLATLGQMATAVSQEFHQPLMTLRKFTQSTLALLDQGKDDAVRANLLRIVDLSRRMEQLVAHLRTQARRQPGPVEPVALGPAILSARELLASTVGKAATIDVRVATHDLAALAQRGRLEQALLNLMRNALEAQPCRAPPVVWAGIEGDRAVIEVRDSGPGFSPATEPRLFEPFFTTKPPGAGMGLGLTVARTIVQSMNGTLTARSVEGGGAVFRIELARVALGSHSRADEVVATAA